MTLYIPEIDETMRREQIEAELRRHPIVQVARESGVSRGVVYNYLDGKAVRPYIEARLESYAREVRSISTTLAPRASSGGGSEMSTEYTKEALDRIVSVARELVATGRGFSPKIAFGIATEFEDYRAKFLAAHERAEDPAKDDAVRRRPPWAEAEK